jgi:hypothetical protein
LPIGHESFSESFSPGSIFVSRARCRGSVAGRGRGGLRLHGKGRGPVHMQSPKARLFPVKAGADIDFNDSRIR